uniref:Uncharacterized protein n=1 Tax=Anguilla anguilla TaxID=7936 RepID=A0A0E9QYM8_ANGAN
MIIQSVIYQSNQIQWTQERRVGFSDLPKLADLSIGYGDQNLHWSFNVIFSLSSVIF